MYFHILATFLVIVSDKHAALSHQHCLSVVLLLSGVAEINKTVTALLLDETTEKCSNNTESKELAKIWLKLKVPRNHTNYKNFIW